jgi:hypothetical protein
VKWEAAPPVPSASPYFQGTETAPLRSFTRHFAARVSISTRMMIAAMSNQNVVCRD